jgi:hypothetical protein
VDENLTGPFEATPVKQLGQSSGGGPFALAAQRRESCENGLTLLEVNIWDLSAVATVPAKGGAAEPLRRFPVEEENELEGFRQPDVLKLSCRREGFNEVLAVESAPETAVGMALRGHEQMFAY